MTNEAQGRGFHSSEPIRRASRENVLALFEKHQPDGWMVDDVCAELWPRDLGEVWPYNFVASVRNAVKDLHVAGKIKEVGTDRNYDDTADQTLYALGEELDVVEARRIEKMHKLCAKCGYRAVPLSDDDNA